MAPSIRLLVADADASVREIVRLAAAEQGWGCDTAGDGITALKLARHGQYQMAVADVDLPEIDGRAVCRQLRKAGRMPVILIGKNGKEEDRLAAFAAGGNDFVQKPFYPRELVARIKNLIEIFDATAHPDEAVCAGKIRVDKNSRLAYAGSSKLRLSPKEYDLLLFLCANAGQAFSRDKLLDMVWGADFEGTDRTVDTHIKSLRGKLKPYQGCIETVWGYGYKLRGD